MARRWPRATATRSHPDPFAEPGWFRTDDLGAIDDAGVLTVLGRADDAISTGGLTVLPQPVEAALGTHPAIRDCAVFGLADDRLGQRVVAAIVVADGCTPPTLDALRAHVTRTLDATAAPRELHIVDALPRRGIGKVDRMALVRRFARRSIGWSIVRVGAPRSVGRRGRGRAGGGRVRAAAAELGRQAAARHRPGAVRHARRRRTDLRRVGDSRQLGNRAGHAASPWPRWCGDPLWRNAFRGGSLTLGTWATACGWAFALAMIDGWQRGFAGRLTTRDEYLSQVPTHHRHPRRGAHVLQPDRRLPTELLDHSRLGPSARRAADVRLAGPASACTAAPGPGCCACWPAPARRPRC